MSAIFAIIFCATAADTTLVTGGDSRLASVSNATSTNTASTLVCRDGSGNFSAGTITSNLTGTASGNLTLASPAQHGILLSGTANATTALASSGTNNFLVGSSGADPVWNTPTQATALLGTVTQSLAGLVSSAGQLLGVNTNVAASAGNVGEVMRLTLALASANSLSTGTVCNMGATTCPSTGGTQSLTLTAGDWSCQMMVAFTGGSSTSVTALYYGVSTTSATMPNTTFTAVPSSGQVVMQLQTAAIIMNGTTTTYAIPDFQVTVANGATTAIYPVTKGTFTVSTLKTNGSFECRRMR